jgi:hypothetical protein
LGQKIAKNRCRPQFGSDQRAQRERHLEGMKRGRNAYHLDGLMIMAKDANWLKMIVCNYRTRRMVDPSSFIKKCQSHIL